MRAFIAAELPEKVKEDIEAVKTSLNLEKFPITWVKKSKIHLTILFLGEIGPEQSAVIRKILTEETADLSPTNLRLARLGCFPGFSRPNTLWLGLGGEVEALARLNQKLRQKISQLGIRLDPKPFSAHLTLGRVKRWASRSQRRQIGERLATARIPAGKNFEIEKITFFKSQLMAEGPVYEKVASVELGLIDK